MATYKQLRDALGQISTTAIQRIEDGTTIPFDLSNRDYQEFLVWAQTHTLAPADPVQDPAINLAGERALAVVGLLSDPTPHAKFIRAVLLVILDEVNTIRALLPGPPAPRTVAQLKTAIQAKINSGAAD